MPVNSSRIWNGEEHALSFAVLVQGKAAGAGVA